MYAIFIQKRKITLKPERIELQIDIIHTVNPDQSK